MAVPTYQQATFTKDAAAVIGSNTYLNILAVAAGPSCSQPDGQLHTEALTVAPGLCCAPTHGSNVMRPFTDLSLNTSTTLDNFCSRVGQACAVVDCWCSHLFMLMLPHS